MFVKIYKCLIEFKWGKRLIPSPITKSSTESIENNTSIGCVVSICE